MHAFNGGSPLRDYDSELGKQMYLPLCDSQNGFCLLDLPASSSTDAGIPPRLHLTSSLTNSQSSVDASGQGKQICLAFLDSENGCCLSDPISVASPKHGETLDLKEDTCIWMDYVQSGKPLDASADEQMDPNLWSNLPDNLLESILAYLPITCILRMRTVCKKWKGMTSSALFLQAHAKLSPRKPYFLMFADHFRRRVSAAYDLGLNKWHLIPLENFVHCQLHESFIILASDGGLFCVEGPGIQSKTIFVSNPITHCQKQLPPMLSMDCPYVVAMVVDRHGGGYKILVAQDGDCLSSQVYDSKSNSWKMTGVLNRSTALLSGASFHNGLLYCIAFGPDGIVSFDLEHGVWHETNLVMPSSLTCPYLFENQGDLMMIGGIEEFGTLKGVHFWRLIPGSKSWVEVKKVPDSLFKMFFKSASGHFLCVGHSDQVCFHDYHYPNVLMYDFVRDEWSWLPSCSVAGNMEVQSVLGFAFEPRLDAEV